MQRLADTGYAVAITCFKFHFMKGANFGQKHPVWLRTGFVQIKIFAPKLRFQQYGFYFFIILILLILIS